MVIPSELPKFVAAIRPGALQSLALQAGAVLDAKVIGPGANGGTQVEIRGQVLNLVLPTLVKAGEAIKLEVHGAGQQMRLALQQAVSLPPASPAPAAPAPDINLPLPNPTAPATPALPQTATPAAQVAQTQQTVLLPQAATTETPAPASSQTTAQTANAAANTSVAAQTASPATPATNAPPAAPSTTQAPGAPPVSAAQPTPGPVATTTVITTTVAAPAPASIYPQANPAQLNPLAVAAAASVATPPSPTPAQEVPGAVRPVVPATAIGNTTAHSSSGNPLPQPPPQPATPQAALAQLVHTSVPQQGAVTSLTTALTSIAGKVVLPEPVVRAAQQVLAGRVAIDAPRFDGSALQAAVRGSGVFQEAGLAQGQVPQGDMKSALLTLRQTLTSWLGQQAPVNAVAQIPPPLRGITPRARAGDAPPPIDPDAAPQEVGKQLLERTESALARVRLHQHASLPDPVARTAEWSMDLPVMVGTQQTLMHIHIHGDPQNEAETPGERGWQMRFALSLPEMGEVGAQVTLRAGATGVMLWATEPGASAALEAEIAALRETLGNAGLRPGAVIVRHGEPPTPAAAAPSGHFVDAQL